MTGIFRKGLIFWGSCYAVIIVVISIGRSFLGCLWCKGRSMSNERLVVVYVGDADTEQCLATSLEPHEGYVYRADELLSVLGMVVSYMPDLVVLDARTAPMLARQVYYHLRTIDAEPILILDHDSDDWEYPEYAQ